MISLQNLLGNTWDAFLQSSAPTWTPTSPPKSRWKRIEAYDGEARQNRDLHTPITRVSILSRSLAVLAHNFISCMGFSVRRDLVDIGWGNIEKNERNPFQIYGLVGGNRKKVSISVCLEANKAFIPRFEVSNSKAG